MENARFGMAHVIGLGSACGIHIWKKSLNHGTITTGPVITGPFHLERYMRIGVVSDTHNNLANCRKIVALFNEAEVDLVIHTGDVTQAKTIDVFGRIVMPMIGVFGNNDVERESLEPAIARAGFEFSTRLTSVSWQKSPSALSTIRSNFRKATNLALTLVYMGIRIGSCTRNLSRILLSTRVNARA